MSTEPNSSPSTESATPATTSAPTTPASAPATTPAKVSPFAGLPAPAWVKSAGLEDAHKRAEATQPQTTTAPVVAANAPEVTPSPTQPTAAPTQSPATPPPTAPFDQNAFAQALATALRPAPQGQPQPQLTEAELRQQLNIFEADAAAYESVFGVAPQNDGQVAALNRILQGVARQAVTMANIMNQRALQQHQESLNPYVTAVRSQEATRQKELFFKENVDLVGYEALTEKEFQLALSSGKKFPNVDAARKYVADNVRATLKTIGISPKAAVAATTQPTTTTAPKPSTSRTMTPTSVGGRSGMSATGKPASKVEAVWGTKR